MNNLEISAKVISAILAKLLQIGIQEYSLSTEDFKLETQEARFLRPCFDWLASEGLVSYANTAHTKDTSCWINPVLTSRGFAVLGSKMSFDGTEATLAEVVEPRTEISGNYTKIGDLLGSALGGFLKSIGS